MMGLKRTKRADKAGTGSHNELWLICGKRRWLYQVRECASGWVRECASRTPI